jgi:hypothetical protein
MPAAVAQRISTLPMTWLVAMQAYMVVAPLMQDLRISSLEIVPSNMVMVTDEADSSSGKGLEELRLGAHQYVDVKARYL